MTADNVIAFPVARATEQVVVFQWEDAGDAGDARELAEALAKQVALQCGCELGVSSSLERTLAIVQRSRGRCIVLGGSETYVRTQCRVFRLCGVVTPILALVRGGADVAAVAAAGADRSFDPSEVRRWPLHVAALVRRSRGDLSAKQRCGPLRLDRTRHKATAAGVWLDLSRSDFDVLSVICRFPGSPVRIEELARELFGRPPSQADHRALVQRMTRLKRKLGRFGRMIEFTQGAYVLRHRAQP